MDLQHGLIKTIKEKINDTFVGKEEVVEKVLK